MAGFKFGDIKGKFSKSGGDDPNNAENENLGAWDFDDDENQDGFADAYGAGDAEDADDAYADDDGYVDDYGRDGDDVDEGEYQDDDAGYGDGEYEDDAEYGDDGYADDGGQARYDDDEDAENLGYNPDIFKNLDDDAPEEEGYADDGEYDQNQQPYGYDDDDDGYAGQQQEYEPAEYDDEPEKQSGGSSDWLIYALLVLLPPVGVWLLWRGNKFDITLRTTLSAASIIWFIILLILLIPLFSSGNDDIQNTNDTPFLNPSSQVQSAAPSVSPTVAPSSTTSAPTSTAGVGIVSPGNTNASEETTYVYMANAGIEYHLIEDCGGLTGANKVTLDFAKQRGLNACPNCAGGTNTVGGTATTAKVYYATTNGTWYHLDANCQDMKGATVVTEANAIAAKKTACPKCIGYYGTLGGKAYHSVSNCQSMQNAITKTKAEWEALGKPACSICIKGGTSSTAGGSGSATPTQTMVYATAGGTYYHTKSDCTGMKNAGYGSLALAVNSYNKKPCPKCVSADTIYVYATPTGEYFHIKNNCSGMKNAVYNKMSVALALNKPACPKCASMLSTSSSTTTLGNGAAVTGKTSTYVYATTNGANFHTDPTCKGMANAKLVTFAQAVSAGKPPCTKCVTADKLMVFATSDGKYYHTKSDCTGMKNAVQVKASVAIANNKKACPTCAKVIANATSSGTTGGTAGTATGTSQSASGSSTVYIKTGSNASDYYHIGARCTALGLSGMSNVTLEYAIEHSYKACPSCKPPSRIST